MKSSISLVLLTLAAFSLAEGQVTPQTNFLPVSFTVNSAPYDIIATPITPQAPYSQAAYQCNVTGDSRFPPYASGTFPLNLAVPVGTRVRVIFANGNLNGATVTQQGEPGVIVQQGGSPIVQQAGGASPIVQGAGSPIVQQNVARPAVTVVQQTPTVVQPGTFNPAPTIPPLPPQPPSVPTPTPNNPTPTPAPTTPPVTPTPTPTTPGSQPPPPVTPTPGSPPPPPVTPTPTPGSPPPPPVTPTPTPASPPPPPVTPTPTPTPSYTPTPTPSTTPDKDHTPTPTPSSTPDKDHTPTPTPSSTPDKDHTPTPTPSSTPDKDHPNPSSYGSSYTSSSGSSSATAYSNANAFAVGRKMLQETVPGGPNNGLVEYIALSSANTVPGFYAGSTQFGVPYVEFTATEAARGQTAVFRGALVVAQVVGGVPLYPFRPNANLSPYCQVNVNFSVA